MGLVQALDSMGLAHKDLPAGALEELAELASEVDAALLDLLGKKTKRDRAAKAAQTAVSVASRLEALGDKLEPLIASELPPFAGEEGVALVQLGGKSKPDPELDAAYAEYRRAHAAAAKRGEPMGRDVFTAAHEELSRLVDEENDGRIDRAGLLRREALEVELWPLG